MDEKYPPSTYPVWLDLDPQGLELIYPTRVKENEKLWISFRLFDLLKDSNIEKACQYLLATTSITSPSKSLNLNLFKSGAHFVSLNNYFVLNEQLFCSELTTKNLNDVTMPIPFSNFENRLFKESIAKLNYKKGVLTNDLSLRILNGIELANLEKNRIEKLNFYKALSIDADKSADPALKNLFNSALQKEFPQFLPLENSNRINIALDLIKDRDFKQAKAHLDYLIQLPSLEKENVFKTYKILFRIEKSTQDKSSQENVLNLWWKWLQTSQKKKEITVVQYNNWFSELLVLRARWYWTEGNPEKALQLLTRFEKNLTDPAKKEELFYTLARIYEEKKNYDLSKKFFEKSFHVANLKNQFFEKTLWSLAWLEYKNKNYLAAENQLELLLSKIKNNSDSKYLYWLARCYSLQGKKDSYINTINLLRSKEPLSFYTLLTFRDEKEPLTLIPRHTQNEKTENLNEVLKNILSPEDLINMRWHLSFKQTSVIKEWAQIVFELDKSHYLTSLILYARAGMHSNLINSINQLTSEQKNDLLAKYPEFLFPKPYGGFVTEYSAKRNILPSLVYSIMRQESAFDPYARSPVDALGLLQLMPAMGKKIAREEGIPFNRDFDLFNEETNIALGTKELSRLLQSNENKYIPTIAGYNASSGAFQGWIKSRYRSDVVEFIEEIPYEETKTYIKLILRNMIFYDRLYFKDQNFLFPEYLLSF